MKIFLKEICYIFVIFFGPRDNGDENRDRDCKQLCSRSCLCTTYNTEKVDFRNLAGQIKLGGIANTHTFLIVKKVYVFLDLEFSVLQNILKLGTFAL